MPKELLIVLICLGSLLALWLLSLIAVSCVLLFCHKKIKRNKMGINIILAQKYDVSGVLAKELASLDVELPEQIVEEFNLKNKPNFDSFSTFERKSVGKQIAEIVSTLLEIVERLNFDNKRISTINKSIEDIEKRHRHVNISQNNLIMAYNYWVKFKPYRPISKLFKIKPIQPIE